MAYATVAQFIASVGQAEAKALAFVVAGGTIDEALIGDKLGDVSATIDTYLAAVVATPVSPSPRTLQVAAIALAREALDKQGRDQVTKEADRLRTWLRDVSKGLATIGGGSGPGDAPAPVQDAGVQISAPDRIFRRGDRW